MYYSTQHKYTLHYVNIHVNSVTETEQKQQRACNSVISKTIPSFFSAFVYFCLFVSGGQWFWLSGRPLNLDREEQRKGGEGRVVWVARGQ